MGVIAKLGVIGLVVLASFIWQIQEPRRPEIRRPFPLRTLPHRGISVENYASPLATISSDEIVRIKGDGFFTGDASGDMTNPPTELNGVTVTVAGQSARIKYVSADEIHIVIPWIGTTGKLVPIRVSTPLGVWSDWFPVRSASPGMFMQNAGDMTSPWAAGWTQVGYGAYPEFIGSRKIAYPAAREQRLMLHGSGFRHASQVRIFLNEIELTPTEYGPYTNFAGFDYVAFILPNYLPLTGIVSLSIDADGVGSNAVWIRFP